MVVGFKINYHHSMAYSTKVVGWPMKLSYELENKTRICKIHQGTFRFVSLPPPRSSFFSISRI
jgi:hypothetical protein